MISNEWFEISRTLNPSDMDVTAIVFDFGGTLDGPGTTWYERFFLYHRDLNPSATWDDYLPLAVRAGKNLSRNPRAGSLNLAETVGHLVFDIVEQGRSTGLIGSPELVVERFLEDASMYLEQSREVLDNLSARYRLACVSNNWGNAEGWCRDLGFDRYFEFVIDSAVVGVRKPDPRIFHIALEKLNLPAERTAYVGDQFKADIEGSKGVGMRSVWLEGEPPRPCPDETLVDRKLRNLNELTGWTGA